MARTSRNGTGLRKRSGAALAALAALAAASPQAGASRGEAELVSEPTQASTHVARLIADGWAFARPSSRSPRRFFARAGGPWQLLVLGSDTDDRGRLWLRVRLPIRPNSASGWINAVRTLVSQTRYWVRVRVGARTVEVLRDGRRIRRFPAVVGRPATPTPTGLFAIYEAVRQANPHGFLGPYALHLTAKSEVLRSFGGGDGRIAIHGRDGASLADPLGTARSNGCIRISNRHVVWLARNVPAGTPVEVTR